MSLDKVLHKHIDEMEEIEAMLQKDIDTAISGIDKNKLIESPSEAMSEVADLIASLIEDKYIPLASKNGLDLSDIIDKLDDKDKEIIVDRSKDPKENADIL